jgi:Predicted pPIWI-associating nuclease
MARRTASLVVPTPSERLIIDTLSRIVPAAAVSYEQCLLDLGAQQRRSYRGVAHELREVLRETLNYLAPDTDVMAAPGFKLERDQERPTQRQKALHVLRNRKLSREEISAPELAVSMVEEMGARITRTAYTRGSKDAHTSSSAPEVRQLKMWIDAVLGELLEIHGQAPAGQA